METAELLWSYLKPNGTCRFMLTAGEGWASLSFGTGK